MNRRTFILTLGAAGALAAIPVATAVSAPSVEDRDVVFFEGVRRRLKEALEKGYPITGFSCGAPRWIENSLGHGWWCRKVIFHVKTETTFYSKDDLVFYHPFDVPPEEEEEMRRCPRYWNAPVGIASWLCKEGHKMDLVGTPGTRKMICGVCLARDTVRAKWE
jgi:hypothetical protein